MRHFNLNLPTVIMTSAVLSLAGGLPALAGAMDLRIESTARNSYNFKTFLRDDAIKVQCSGGVVTLTGTVAQDDHKALAQETVAGLPGVKSVINLLAVAADQPKEQSDLWITMKVKNALTFHKNVSATATSVTTKDGIVTLTGHADSEAKKELTGEYAKDVEGVTEVRNDLVVGPGGHPIRSLGVKVDDASITAQIKTSILFHKSTHALATKVTTKAGVVTLHGEAADQAEKDRVTKIAEDINGVKRVNNRMTLRQS
ncbi:MAG: BON domain-containing protein [Holophaga sp.]|nr:BON domain-containing protein [Holophaga sp.]